MDSDIDEVAQASVIISKEGTVLSIISYFLRTYAYLAVGTLLTFVNIPVFVLIIMRKKLRDSYLVLAVVFFNNGFTGISAISLSVKRLIDSANGERGIDHHKCVLNIPTLLLTAYFLDGFSLLMNSIERFCVIAFPIYYYTHSIRISYSLIIAQYTITIIAIISTVVASLIEPTRQISNFCLLQSSYLPEFYSNLLVLSTTASLLSVVFMIIVVIILRKKFGAQYLSTHSHDHDLSHFLKNQKRYTYTALISCCFTFCMFLHSVLNVVPSIVQYIYVLDPTARSRTVVIACVYLPFLNSFNMIIFFVYRQGDFRRALIHSFKWLFCRQKNQIQQTTVVGFGR